MRNCLREASDSSSESKKEAPAEEVKKVDTKEEKSLNPNQKAEKVKIFRLLIADTDHHCRKCLITMDGGYNSYMVWRRLAMWSNRRRFLAGVETDKATMEARILRRRTLLILWSWSRLTVCQLDGSIRLFIRWKKVGFWGTLIKGIQSDGNSGKRSSWIALRYLKWRA